MMKTAEEVATGYAKKLEKAYAANTKAVAELIALEVKLGQVREHVKACRDCSCPYLELNLEPAAVEKVEKSPEALSIVFYDCRDNELLDNDEPGAAIAELIDYGWEKELSKRENVEKHCPIEVKAYARDRISEEWIDGEVEALFEVLEEHMLDAFGNPDHDHDFWGVQIDEPQIKSRFRVAVKHAAKTAEIWQCSVVDSKEYELEEALEMLVEHGYFDAHEVGA